MAGPWEAVLETRDLLSKVFTEECPPPKYCAFLNKQEDEVKVLSANPYWWKIFRVGLLLHGSDLYTNTEACVQTSCQVVRHEL